MLIFWKNPGDSSPGRAAEDPIWDHYPSPPQNYSSQDALGKDKVD